MEIRQISMRQDITGMATLRNRLFFFTKDGLYFIEMPVPKPWYHRAWERLKARFGR